MQWDFLEIKCTPKDNEIQLLKNYRNIRLCLFFCLLVCFCFYLFLMPKSDFVFFTIATIMVWRNSMETEKNETKRGYNLWIYYFGGKGTGMSLLSEIYTSI